MVSLLLLFEVDSLILIRAKSFANKLSCLQFEFEDFKRIEELISKHTDEGKMSPYKVDPFKVKSLEDAVNEAEKKARQVSGICIYLAL